MKDRTRALQACLVDLALAGSMVVRAGHARNGEGRPALEPLDAAVKRARTLLSGAAPGPGDKPPPGALALLRAALRECEAEKVDWSDVVAIVNRDEGREEGREAGP